MAPSSSGAPDALLVAFLEGAGMSGAKPENAETTMRALGAAFRATVSGIRQALIARASIKGEFRIEQTMIRARGNNPLKFSADDDDALSALLGTGRRMDMKPDAAVADALRDMRLHELATMAAMQKDPSIGAVLGSPFALTPGFAGPAQPDGEKGYEDKVTGSWVAPFMMAALAVVGANPNPTACAALFGCADPLVDIARQVDRFADTTPAFERDLDRELHGWLRLSPCAACRLHVLALLLAGVQRFF